MSATQPTRASFSTNFVRSTERDDVLLYITAAIGIFVPGCVYMFYQYAHKLYTSCVEVIFSFYCKKITKHLHIMFITILLFIEILQYT